MTDNRSHPPERGQAPIRESTKDTGAIKPERKRPWEAHEEEDEDFSPRKMRDKHPEQAANLNPRH